MGACRAHRSDSYTSYMSEMARGGHLTDSRTSMIGKYNRTMGGACAPKDVSFSSEWCFYHTIVSGWSKWWALK